MRDDIRKMLATIARGDGRITVLTGAGISAESGIPTFRGPEGYWTVGSQVYQPQEMATFWMFTHQPDEVWKWYLYRMGVCARAEPNPGHLALAEMERRFGDRFTLFAGLDDVALEGLYLGAQGWVSGLTNAFPKESVELVRAFERGDHAKAMEIYRWFMPLLHLDAEHDLVQSIKLAEQVMGRGSERVLPPRYVLEGARRAEVIAMVEKAAATRPELGSAKAA